MGTRKEILNLMDNGAVIYVDFIKGLETFKVVNGMRVKQFSLEILGHLKREGIIFLKSVQSFHSVYYILPESKRKELGLSI